MARSSPKDQEAAALGPLLRQRRKSLGLTAKQVARLAGVSPSYISHLERGRHERPSLAVLARLAQALDVPLAEVCAAVLPVAPLGAPPLPPALATVAAEDALDAATLVMLRAIWWNGRQPTTPDGWRLVLLAIQAACTDGHPVAHATA